MKKKIFLPADSLFWVEIGPFQTSNIQILKKKTYSLLAIEN